MKVLIDGVQFIPAPKPAEGEGLDAALDVRFDSDAGPQLTVREYLRELLLKVWDLEEEFSGKRPFGNSGWETDLTWALARAGFVNLGVWDEETEGYEYTTAEQEIAARAYVHELILHAFR